MDIFTTSSWPQPHPDASPCHSLSGAANATSGYSWANASINSTCNLGVDVRVTINPYPQWVVIFLWLLAVVLSVETILGNLLVLMAYKLERNIRRQLSNKFIVSLAITDLIIGMEGFPLLTVYVVGRELWPLGHLLCQLWLFLDYTLCLVSILNVLLITVDRYGSVCYPAKYRVWQTRARVRAFIFMSWIVPCVLFGMMIFAWEPMTGHGMDNSGKCYAPFLDDPYVNMAMYIIYYWTTLVAMSVLYRGIHTAAKALEDKSKARERQTIALLLGQRCMAQVGVGMLLHSSASDEENIESFFHAPTTVDCGYVTDECGHTDIVRDTSYTGSTTSATMTNTLVNSRGPVRGYQILSDDAGVTSDSEERTPLNVPAIVTPRVSIASATSTLAPESPSSEKQRFLQRRILYDEFGDGDDEDEDAAFSLVPLINRADGEGPESVVPTASPSVTSGFFTGSPSRAKIFTSYNGAGNGRSSSSFRRVLAPMHSYGGVANLAAKTKRPKLMSSLSLDEEQMGAVVKPATRKSSTAAPESKKPLFGKATVTPKRQPRVGVGNQNGIDQESMCSLNFYDSNKGSAGSLYGDTSLHSVIEFDSFDSTIEEKLKDSVPGSTDASLRDTLVIRHQNGDLARQAIPESASSFSFNSVTSSQTWTVSTSTKSPLSPSIDLLPVTEAVATSSSTPAELVGLAEETRAPGPPHSRSEYPVSARSSIQIKISPDSEFLTPIIEEEKSTATNSRPNSVTPSPCADSPRRKSSAGPSSQSRGRQGTKRHRDDQKVVHLTVPGSASKSGVFNRRKSSAASTTAKKGSGGRRRANSRETDWTRASWQSTTSSIYYDENRENSRRFTGGSRIDDDEDSCASGAANRDGTRPGSVAEDYPPSRGRKGSGHWLMNLFRDPASILNRKRKVTKAERRARKAFRTITVIVGTFALFWSPYYIVATIYGFCPECIPAPLFLTSYYLCYLNSSVNPFAYAFANRLFRKTFIRILRGDLRRT